MLTWRAEIANISLTLVRPKMLLEPQIPVWPPCPILLPHHRRSMLWCRRPLSFIGQHGGLDKTSKQWLARRGARVRCILASNNTVRSWYFQPRTKFPWTFLLLGVFIYMTHFRISQEKHLSSGFPLSHHQNNANWAALVGKLAGTG